MATPGGDPFLGLLSGGISFDKKRFARDISLFKPQARVLAARRCVFHAFLHRMALALTAGCAELRCRWLRLRLLPRPAARRAALAA